MLKRIFNTLLMLALAASFLYGSGVPVGAQSPSTQQASASSTAPQRQGTVPNDDIGGTNGMGQMRTTTNAMRVAAASHLNLQKKGVAQTFAGLDPAKAARSPLSALPSSPGELLNPLATMAPRSRRRITSASPTGLTARCRRSILPVNLSGGMRKFVDTLPGLCGLSPWGTSWRKQPRAVHPAGYSGYNDLPRLRLLRDRSRGVS